MTDRSKREQKVTRDAICSTSRSDGRTRNGDTRQAGDAWYGVREISSERAVGDA
jgi:hypothetical protein